MQGDISEKGFYVSPLLVSLVNFHIPPDYCGSVSRKTYILLTQNSASKRSQENPRTLSSLGSQSLMVTVSLKLAVGICIQFLSLIIIILK